jgi:phosphoglycerate dehydrogenase-like enzyme
METILNLLPLTPQQRSDFLLGGEDCVQVFAPDGFMMGSGASAPLEVYSAATVILGNPPPGYVARNNQLCWLHTRSAGVDSYLAPGVLCPNTILTCSTGAYGLAVSEHMFAVLLAMMKRLPGYRDEQMKESWLDLGCVKTLTRATVLVVGTGDLGSRFARLCKALGASTIGIRKNYLEAVEGIDRMYPLHALDQLLPQVDVAALMLPQTADTFHLITRERLLLMKQDAILLNGGRGSAVDCDALAAVLSDGHLWGAGLDVTDPEPLPANHPLWQQPRALITPHIAGGDHLAETTQRVVAIALTNLKNYLSGAPLLNQVLHS